MTLRLALAAALLFVAGCAPTAPLGVPPVGTEQAAPHSFTILQLNDVYEITPVEGGRSGGLARVATLKKRLEAEGVPVLTVMAGDFFSPSALGTARVDGERIAGAQMVAVLNALGLDVAALGNHEFDLSAEAFRARIAESDFAYVSANVEVEDPDGGPLKTLPPRVVLPLTLADGSRLSVGFTSAVLASNPRDYVVYSDPLEALRLQLEVMDRDDESDVEIALTHLAFADDATVAATMPAVDLVMGGHEHENIYARRGGRMIPVAKADANARTVYVHRLTLDRATDAVDVASELVPITDALPDDPAVAAVVAEWVERASVGFRADGFEPGRVAVVTTEPLDGREGTVRTRPARLGALIAEGFLNAAHGAAEPAQAALFNGGSVRIDDVITPGPFTEYDAIRVLPFGGNVVTVRLPGALLARVLDQGLANAGTGGFLQTAGVGREADRWSIDGQPLDPTASYVIATNDFLILGLETGLDYFDAEDNPDVTPVAEHGDVRRALIDELVRQYGAAE